MSIHPSAVISPQARISADVEVGAYTVIAGAVEVGAHTVIESHVRIGSPYGEVTIGEHNYIQSGAMLGGPPQDWSYRRASTRLVIGDHNRIGESATLNLGSQNGGGVTKVGDRTFIMAYVHIGHDCQIAEEVVLTNLTQLAGHVRVERNVVVGGMVPITQFVRLGEYSFVAAGAAVNKDILPYTVAEGHWAVPRAANKIGLKRAGFSEPQRRNIDRAVRILLKASITVEEALDRIAEVCAPDPQIEHLTGFVRSSRRGIARA